MEAFFLDGARGPLLAVHHAATGGRVPRQGLVYLPPFAEEMNRARRMAARQARRLAALGIDVLLLDPFGTGDSAGDFGEARWETWRSDAEAATAWRGDRCGGPVGLWGLRLGALLAAEVAAQAPGRVSRLVLWQPVLTGDRFLTQFLRLRVAAGMADPSGAKSGKESTKYLRQRLVAGEALEVGGYELAPALAEAVGGLQLAPLLGKLEGTAVDWLEVSSGGSHELLPASQQIITGMTAQRPGLRAQAVAGEPFWAIQEFTLAPALLEATDALFRP